MAGLSSGNCDFFGLGRDWLDARLPVVFEKASAWFGGHVGDLLDFSPPARTGYGRGCRSSQPVAVGSLSLLGDHPRSLGWSMLSATGASAEWGWNACVTSFPVVQANRIDSALDFRCSESRFSQMLVDGEAICRRAGRRPFPMGTSVEGRTLYFNWHQKKEHEKSGNEKVGQYTARLYEKGKQLDCDPEWRRFEVSVRPDKAVHKERVFGLEPHQLLCCPDWSRAFLSTIGYSDILKPARSSPFACDEPVSLNAKVARKMVAVSHLLEQYGSTLNELGRLIGYEAVDEMLMLYKRPVIALPDGRETTPPAYVRRMAQARWSDVFHDDIQRKRHLAGDGVSGNL